jgi:hypothetical protein
MHVVSAVAVAAGSEDKIHFAEPVRNLEPVRFPAASLIAGSPLRSASRSMMTSGDSVSIRAMAADTGEAGIGGELCGNTVTREHPGPRQP